MPGIDECLLDAMRLPGVQGAAVIDWTSGLALGTTGDPPHGDHEAAAAESAELARMAAEHQVFSDTAEVAPAAQQASSGACPVLEPSIEDIVIASRSHYHVLRFVPTAFDSSVFLHLWLHRPEGNLALARIRLAEMAQRLVLG